MTTTKRKGRPTKEEALENRRNRITNDLLLSNKYLNDPKFYKNNYWSWAAWDSWAAQGKAGSCICGCGYYNGTLKNKRAKTRRGGCKEDWPVDISPKLCSGCVELIEQKINTSFPKK